MSKYFTMSNFWILVGTIIFCIAPWLTLAIAVAFFAGVFAMTKAKSGDLSNESEPEPDVGDPDSAIEWPAIEYPNLTAVIDEEKAVAEARAAKAKAEYEAKADRHFTYFKIAIVPILIGGVLLSNYIDEKKAPVTAQSTQTTCVKNAVGNTECSYVKK